MNYLGHLIKSLNLPSGMRVGNVLGDFWKGRTEHLPPPLKEGILYHRRIDAWTDRHPIVRSSFERIRGPLRRYAGILVDMYFDHFLALEWRDWSGRELEDSVHTFYLELDGWKDWWPPALREAQPWLVEHDWFCSYREISALERSFRGLSRRLKVPNNKLHEGIGPLLADYEGFRGDFRSFMAEFLGGEGPERGPATNDFLDSPDRTD